MEGDARSVFVLLRYIGGPGYTSGLYEIKIKRGGKVIMGPRDGPHDPLFPFFDATHDQLEVPTILSLECARLCSKLYPLPNEGLQPVYSRRPTTSGKYSGKYDSYRGYIFDTETRLLDTFEPPLASKPVSFVMSAYGKLYNLASPVCFSEMPKTLFERYDPQNKSWKRLSHFAYSRQRAHTEITGYAVCYGCILVSIGRVRVELMVYNIDTNTWHQVNISRSDVYYSAFRGRAVVVDNTIYALSIRCGKVITFSLRMDSDDDGRIIYSVEKPFFLSGLKSRVEEDSKAVEILKRTEYLVHLGKLEFCLLQTNPTGLGTESQPLFITTFQIVRDGTMHVKTLDSSVFDVRIKSYGRINVSFCFTPESEDRDPKKEEFFQLAKKKGTAKNNTTLDSKVHDVGTEGCDRFVYGFTLYFVQEDVARPENVKAAHENLKHKSKKTENEASRELAL